MSWVNTALCRALIFWAACVAVLAWRRGRLCRSDGDPLNICTALARAWEFFLSHNYWGMLCLALFGLLATFGPFLLWGYASHLDTNATEENVR